jgi:hypothetical protein
MKQTLQTIKIKAITTNNKVIIVMSLNIRLAATEITQFHGPATYVFELQMSDESFPMTPCTPLSDSLSS